MGKRIVLTEYPNLEKYPKVETMLDSESLCGYTQRTTFWDDFTIAEKLGVPAILDNKLNESEWDLELLKDLMPSIDFSDFEVDWNLGEEKEKESKDKEKGEVPFAEILGEENNYIVLKFNNTVDWLQIESLFGLENRQAYSTRTDGKIGKNMKRIGVGRVVDGAEFLNKIGVDL